MSAESGQIDRGIWVLASVVVLGAIMSILDTTIVNVALDALGRDFHAPLSSIPWLTTGYLAALAYVPALLLPKRRTRERPSLPAAAGQSSGSTDTGREAAREELLPVDDEAL